jgi:hypothetical protein
MNLLSPAHAEMLTVLAQHHHTPAGRSDAWHWVGSPVMLDADVLERDLAAIVRLCTLVDRLPELAFGGDQPAYLRHLGLPAALDDIVAGGDLPGDFFARPDCVMHDGRLRVLELNVGTGTVNLAAAVATALYLAGAVQPAVHGLLSDRWMLEEWAADRRYAKVLAELGGSGPVGLWYHDASADGRRLTEDMCEVLAVHDIDAVPVHTDEVPACDLPLYACFSAVHLLGPTGPRLASTVRAGKGQPGIDVPTGDPSRAVGRGRRRGGPPRSRDLLRGRRGDGATGARAQGRLGRQTQRVVPGERRRLRQ